MAPYDVRMAVPYVKYFGNNNIVELAVNQTVSCSLILSSELVVTRKIIKTAGDGAVTLALRRLFLICNLRTIW